MSNSKTPLSPREHEVLDIVGEVMQERLAEVRRDIAALEARLAKLEESKRLSYRGAFTPAEPYDSGDYCSHGGSVWCCIRDTSPGDAGPQRKLAPGDKKRGRMNFRSCSPR